MVSFASHAPSRGEVLRGMTKPPEVLVYVDMTLAMQEGGVKFYRDERGNVVSAGQATTHSIPPIFFQKVVNARDGSSLLSTEEVATMRVRERAKVAERARKQQIA